MYDFKDFGYDDEDALYQAQANLLGHDYDYWKEKGEAFKKMSPSGFGDSFEDLAYMKEAGLWEDIGLKGEYDKIQPEMAKAKAEKETGEIASTASDTAIRESTNALRSAGQSKGQSALGGGNAGAVTYGNTFINNHGAIQSSAMNKLYEQLAAQQDLNQMQTALKNEENAQKQQLMMNIMSTIGNTAKGFATGGWVGAAAGLLF